MATSLFEKYGGFASVSKIVSGFYDKVLDSDDIGPYFDNIDMRQQIDHQTKFVASLMGGPASYSDGELTRIHTNLDISNGAFNEMAMLLEETLEDFDFEPNDISAVMNEIQSRRHCIVVNPQ